MAKARSENDIAGMCACGHHSDIHEFQWGKAKTGTGACEYLKCECDMFRMETPDPLELTCTKYSTTIDLGPDELLQPLTDELQEVLNKKLKEVADKIEKEVIGDNNE